MIRPFSISNQSKYRSWLLYYGLLLTVCVSPIHVQAASAAQYTSKAVKPDYGLVGAAPQDQSRLEPGKPIERELSGGQSHSYQLKLAAGQFLNVIVEQQGIDIMVQLSEPGGAQIAEFDGERRSQGQELASHVAEATGLHLLTVQPRLKNAPLGGYEIRIEELRAATENDRALYDARKLLQGGLKLRSAGKYGEALPLVERSREIRERLLGPEHQDVAEALNSLGRLYKSKGDYAKAEPLFKRALAIQEKILGLEHPGVATIINDLAMLYLYKGEYEKTELLHQRALAIREKVLGPEHPDVAASLNNLAYFHYERGAYPAAQSLFQRALAIMEKSLGPEHPNVATALTNLANICNIMGEYVKVESLYQRALTIREKVQGPEHPDVAASLNNLAGLHYERGEYLKAESLFQRSLDISEKVLGPDHLDLRNTLKNFATLYQAIGNYTKAESLFQRGLEIEERGLGPNHPDIAFTLSSFASFYRARGSYTQAETLCLRALAIQKRALGPDHPDVAFILQSIADLYCEKGDYAKAEQLYQRALAIMEKAVGLDHRNTANTLNRLAEVHFNRGDFEQAERIFQQALAIRERALGPDHPNVAISLSSLATLYRDRGDYVKAEQLIQRALAIRNKALGPEHPDVARSIESLAVLYRDKGEYAKAEPLFQRALAILENALGPYHPHFASSLDNLAELYAARGDLAHAVKVQARANSVSERNLAVNLSIGSERQKLAYLALFSEQTDFTLSLHSRALPHDPQALDLAFTTLLRRKGRGLDVMANAIAALRRRSTPEDQALFDRLVEARSQLAALTLSESGTDKPEAYRTRLKPLTDKVEELESSLSARSPEFRAHAQPITLAAVQAALPVDSALIEFAVYTPRDMKSNKNEMPSRYLAYLLAAQGEPRWVDLGEAAPIDRAITAWRRALRNQWRSDVKRLARVVDEKLMRPVRSLLSEMPGDPRRLLIAPDGSLNLIPFAALVDEQNRYLIERYSISYLTSGRDLLRLQTSEPSKGDPLVVANPDFGRFATIAMQRDRDSGKLQTRKQMREQIDPAQIFFQPLPATEDEALAIKAMLPNATLLRKEQATETSLKQASRPQILHIATHGFFLDYQAPAPAEAEDEKPNIVPQTITGTATRLATSYTIQLEATPALETAQERVKQLRAQSIDAYILKSNLKSKGMFFRVRVGNFPTHAEANKYGADLQGEGIAREFFVASYKPSQGDLMKPESTIANAAAKPVNPAPVSALPANSQSLTETRSVLRLSKFAAQVKDPLLRSGLALAGANRGDKGDDDGILTALEVAYLDLLGTKLVVLSACDTGVGDVKKGEGVQGLRRALVVAGSESQVMSLWPVPDRSTKDLMILYYKALQQGEGRSEGLRQVQLRMLRGHENRRHPFYWAAFIQSGEWATLDGQR
jgi:CHAT domain-containing protein/Tfp pilus assembly protein PilF